MCMCVCLLSFSFTHTPLLFCLSYCSFVFVFFIVWCVGETTTHILFRYCASFILIAYRLCLSILFFLLLFISFKLCISKRRRRRRNKRVVSIYLPFLPFFLCVFDLCFWNDVFFLFSSVCLPYYYLQVRSFFLPVLYGCFFFVFVVD